MEKLSIFQENRAKGGCSSAEFLNKFFFVKAKIRKFFIIQGWKEEAKFSERNIKKGKRKTCKDKKYGEKCLNGPNTNVIFESNRRRFALKEHAKMASGYVKSGMEGTIIIKFENWHTQKRVV
jgi:hypothetical protein